MAKKTARCAKCGTPIPKRKDPKQNLCERCSTDFGR
jgi:DNA-directed RNA polymerase subunit RPC12/RpoP